MSHPYRPNLLEKILCKCKLHEITFRNFSFVDWLSCNDNEEVYEKMEIYCSWCQTRFKIDELSLSEKMSLDDQVDKFFGFDLIPE